MADDIERAKKHLWFGCLDCNYKHTKPDRKVNEFWNAFDVKPCPKCGKDMTLQLTNRK